MYPSEPFDIGALSVSILLLLIYHVVYVVEVYLEKTEVFNLSINSKITDLWVNKYFKKRTPEAMMEVIHCLRNTTLIAIFLGGYTLETSYTLMSTAMTSFIPTNSGDGNNGSSNNGGGGGYGNNGGGGYGDVGHFRTTMDTYLCSCPGLYTTADTGTTAATSMSTPVHSNANSSPKEPTSADDISSIVLTFCLFSSFLCWVQVLRNCIHLGYVIDGWDGPVIPYEHISSDSPSLPRMKARATCPKTFSLTARKEKFCHYAKFLARNVIVYFSFAFRFLYISIPFAFYSLGSIALLISTVIMLVLEVMWDYQLF